VQLFLERTESKSVPVRAVIERGALPPELEIYAVNVTPSSVVVTGPRSHLGTIREVATEAIPLAGQKESLRTFVQLNIADTMVHSTPVRPVEVYVEIGPRRRLRLITEVPVHAEEGEITVIPSKVSLQVLVPVGFKGSLTRADFSASVSLRNVDPSVAVTRVRPDVSTTGQLDPAIRVKEVIPPMVTVRRGGRGSEGRGRS
jgi:YbbR domain-containing protein